MKASGWNMYCMCIHIRLTTLGTSIQCVCVCVWVLIWICFVSSWFAHLFHRFFLVSFFHSSFIKWILIFNSFYSLFRSYIHSWSCSVWLCLHLAILNVSHFNLIRMLVFSFAFRCCCFGFFIAINRFRAIEISNSSFFSAHFIRIYCECSRCDFANKN